MATTCISSLWVAMDAVLGCTPVLTAHKVPLSVLCPTTELGIKPTIFIHPKGWIKSVVITAVQSWNGREGGRWQTCRNQRWKGEGTFSWGFRELHHESGATASTHNNELCFHKYVNVKHRSWITQDVSLWWCVWGMPLPVGSYVWTLGPSWCHCLGRLWNF